MRAGESWAVRFGCGPARTAGWAAVVGATLALNACRVAGPAPGGPRVEGLPRAEPTVRVGIVVDTTEAVVGAEAPYELAVAGGDVLATAEAGEEWTFTADAAGRVLARSDRGGRIGPVDGPVRVQARDEGEPVIVAGQPYRGAALVRAAETGRVTVVNAVALEAYLLGVVPAEIPATEVEAVKAQAVAARTYAIGHLGNRDALGFDFFDTVADQVYGGIAKEHPVTSQAVRDTRGEILAYDGRPILAYYHSTCGGRTAAVSEVWSRAPQPYLQSVSDRIPGTEDRYYCETSNRFRWTETWTGDQLEAILAKALADYTGREVGPIEAVRDLEITGHTESGRAEAIRIVLADGSTFRVRGDSIRWVLRPEPDRILNSALLLELDREREDGAIRRLAVEGGGWGHGVGMCQIGAMGRAAAGHGYREILEAYYRGTEIVDLY